MGRHDEAIAELRRALELDPLSRVIHTELARVFYHARRYDSALAAIERAADLDSTFIDLAWMRAQVLEQRGRYAEAITAFRTGAGAIPVGAEIARVQATMGRPEAARRTLDSVIADARRTGAYLAPATLAEVHWVLGERDRAIELLEQAFATGVDDRLSYLKVLPTLDPMRDDPRFQDLLRRMQFPPD
jgi:tetratricopeptide (TPR) repeat protein